MSDALAMLDAIPVEQISAAICRLAARAMTPVQDESGEEYLTVDDVCRLLRVERKFVYAHARDLGVIRLNRRKLRFSRRRVQRFMESRR